MAIRIHTFTPEELADTSLQAAMFRPRGAIAGVPYLLVEEASAFGLPQTVGLPLTELRDALAALPGPPEPTTVAGWNERALARRRAVKERQGIQGLRCSACGGELVDTHPDVLLASNPPKKRLDCPACSNIEYVYV